MEAAFWISFVGVAYAYFGYPLVLMLVGAMIRPSTDAPFFAPESAPAISLLIPAHNEAGVIGRKLDNTLSLYYPGEFQVIVVSDGSTDATSQIVSSYREDSRLVFADLPERKGKANALNKGLELAAGEIIVFSDASILLEEQALWEIVQPFADVGVGCVSGDDRIEGGGGEGLYGKYELFLRRQESKSGSIVGASGSFYAQRRALVTEFPEGVAPDFLSVLNTVQNGYRAISASKAVGYMTAVADTGNEFRRKVRTVIRGMTALFHRKSLLNPIKYPMFSFFLLSHKVMRWYVPFFLVSLLITSLLLIGEHFYSVLFGAQVIFYLLAAMCIARLPNIRRTIFCKIIVYFTVVNAAIMVAWVSYFSGSRPEVWTPSIRDS